MDINNKVFEQLNAIITDSKKEMFQRIAANRTNYLTVALENIQKDHNASAVIRTCDCLGIQNIHLIEKNEVYGIQREIARGAASWVNFTSHSDGNSPSITAIDKLKKEGYQIVATSPHAEHTLDTVPIDNPIALFFGTERDGISKQVIENADHLVKIPMYGFTESFNVSVSVAIVLNQLRNRLDATSIDWKLNELEQIKLKIDWCTKVINEGVKVEKEIRRRIIEKE
ncbi:MAG: RNA methyltransferase [Crocinitomicaceae bacterium]|nr:RNA methyltransferase [Crocinitomicaceae bacterium]